MTSVGPQDGEIEDPDLDEEAEASPQNGAHHQGAPDVRITFPKGRKKPNVEGQAELDALAALGGGGKAYTVEVLAPPDGWPGSVALGILPFTLAASDLPPDRLVTRIGGGTFRIAIGKASKVVTLVGAPKNFGPAKPAEPDQTPTWVQTPQGPQLVYLPKGVPPPPPFPWGGAFGGGWGGAPAAAPDMGATVAKAVAEAMKPILELLGKKNDDGASKFALEVEKTKLEIAREDGKARATEATEARKAREAEIKANADTEGKRLQANADAQVKAAEALAKAQGEMAQASIKVAEARGKSEEGQIDRFIKWQERMSPKESPMSEMLAVYKAINGIAIAAKPSATVEILDGISKLIPAVGAEIRGLAAALPAPAVAAPTAPTQPAAPAQNPPAQITEQTKAEIEEFMSVVRTVRTAIKEKRSPQETADKLKGPGGAPKVMAFIAASAPEAIFQKAALLAGQQDAIVPPASKADLAELGALIGTDEGRAWFGTFYALVKEMGAKT